MPYNDTVLVPLVCALLTGTIAIVSFKLARSALFPPTLYCGVWTVLEFWLAIGGQAYYPISVEAGFVFVAAGVLFTAGGALALRPRNRTHSGAGATVGSPRLTADRARFITRCIDWAIVIQLALAPVYFRMMFETAGSLADDLATGLRLTGTLEKSDLLGGKLGLFSYLIFAGTLLAFAAVTVADQSRRARARALVASTIPLLYSFATMGRTPMLVLLSGTVAIAVTRWGLPRFRVMLLLLALALAIFAAPAVLLGKGVTRGASASEAAYGVVQSLTHYAVSPLVAFSLAQERPQILERQPDYFPFLSALAYRSGLTSDPPPPRVLEYVYTPLPTNVYPLFTNWVLDYGYVGLAFYTLALGWFCSELFYRARSGSPAATMLFGLAAAGILGSYLGDWFWNGLSSWLQALLICGILFHFPIRERRHRASHGTTAQRAGLAGE